VLDPLREDHKHGFDAPVVILVDALDESLSHEGNPKIVQLLARLRNLPPGVRFILTGRDDARVESEFQGDGEYPQGVFISEESYTKSNTKDMGDYLRRRLSEDGVLKKKLSDFSPTRAASIVRLITTRARGNFQYVSFVLDGLSLGRRSFSDLRKLPPSLYSLYHDSLKQVVASDGHRDAGAEVGRYPVRAVARRDGVRPQAPHSGRRGIDRVSACRPDQRVQQQRPVSAA
jgi:hypothetical protein